MKGAVQRITGLVRRTPACHCARLMAALAFAVVADARGESLSKSALLNLQFEQKLNARVPLQLSFTNEDGAAVPLRAYFGRRPVILVLGYYDCPMLCGLVLNGVVESLQDLRPTAGQDFDVLFVSIDPSESPALAAATRRRYLKRYGRANAEQGWHFLVGRAPEIKALCDAVGYQYAYDSSVKQFAHPSGIVVLTPKGNVSKYIFGVAYPGAELNAALKEAGALRVGSPVQQFLILCFKSMPLTGQYSGTIMGAVQGLAVATVLALIGYVTLSLRRERHHRSPIAPGKGEGTP